MGGGGLKPELIAGEGRDRHFLSSSNPPDVSGRCFAHFISCRPHKWSVRKVAFLFLDDGSQRSEKIGDLLEVTKCESPQVCGQH